MSQIVTSSKKIMYRILLVTLAAFLGFLAVKILEEYDPNSFIKAGNLMFSIIFFLLAAACLVVYMSVKDVTISATQAEFKSFLGQKTTTMRLSDIRYYTIQVLRNKYGKDSEAITLFDASNASVKLKGNLYNNYEEMKHLLIKDLSRNEKLEAQIANKSRFKASTASIFFGSIIILCSYLSRETIVSPNDIVLLKEMAGDNIEHIKRSKSSSASLTIRLMKYPGYRFKISDLGFKATDSDAALNEVRIGDTITIGISKEEFEKKIAKTVAPTLFDKYFEYERIKVYSLSNKDYQFLSLENYNLAVKKHPFFGMGYFSFLGIIILGLGLFNFFKAKKELSQADLKD